MITVKSAMPMKVGDYIFVDSDGLTNHWHKSPMDYVAPIDPVTNRPPPRRTMEDVLDCLKCGKLYQITRKAGNAALCCRVRSKKGKLYLDKAERASFLRPSDMIMPCDSSRL